jgi:hypothetical protein
MLKKLFILLLALPVVVSAQKPDTLKSDTLKHRITRQITLSADYSEEVSLPFDTAFSLFNHYKRVEKVSEFNAWPGNYGQPLYQLNFFDRITDPDKFVYKYYYPYMHLPDNLVFMDTQVPFTELSFLFAGPRDRAEQEFRIRHSQNVNRKLNFGLVFDIVYSLGKYAYQRANDKDFSLYSSYRGDKYKLYAQFGSNSAENLENGGIVDPEQMKTYQTGDIETNLGSLNNAKTVMKNRNLLFVQRFSVNKPISAQADSAIADSERKKFRMSGTFSHIFMFDRTRRDYSDSYPGSGFYDTTYISDLVTFDTLSFRNLRNTLRFDFSTDESRKVSLGVGFGIRNELLKYSQLIPTLTGTPPDSVLSVWTESNNALVGRMFNNIGNKFRWGATGELYITGRRSGDFALDGVITKDFGFKKGMARWEITGSMTNTEPSVWMERYGSNHFKWDNSFQKELRINAGTRFTYPERKASLRFNYAIIDNYTYFGVKALPEQHTGGLSVVSLMLKKELQAWKFHLANEVLLQQSSNTDVVDLPLVAVRSAGFFEHNFHFKITNGYLRAQIGAEVFYNTSYHAYSYMPSLGTYYNTETEKTGNYPYLTAFLNVKIKRTRIMLMLDHFNHGWTGYNYFMVPSNPMNTLYFRYGFAWTFYD